MIDFIIVFFKSLLIFGGFVCQMNQAADLADARGMGSAPTFPPPRIQYVLGRCCYCEQPCEPDGYMHKDCAQKRWDAIRKAREEAKGK